MTQLSPADKYPAGYLEQMKTLLGTDYPAYVDSLCRLPVKGLRLNTLKLSPEAFLSLLRERGEFGPGADAPPDAPCGTAEKLLYRHYCAAGEDAGSCPGGEIGQGTVQRPASREDCDACRPEGLVPDCHEALPAGETGQRTVPRPVSALGWVREGFRVGEEAYGRLAKHPYYHAGLYYLQEPSAQTPASRLPVKPGDYVLDLCAAPGGKTTQLLMRLKGQGFLLANDVSASRAQALKRNLQTAGAVNAFVTAEEPAGLAGRYPGFFDAVLVDAPCSGEGMFRREPSMVRYYETRGPWAYAPLQAEILEAAVRMLRPGGHLMFSTCTFSPLENENNVLQLLARHPDLRLIPVEPPCEGFAPGALAGTEECVRIYPHRMAGEGQFMALFKKAGEARPRKPGKAAYLETGGTLYRLPEGIRPERGIRYLLTGLDVAAVKGKKLLPSQPLAMALGGRDWDKILNLTLGDVRVEKYLKGETIEAAWEEITDGRGVPGDLPPALDKRDLLVTVDGFPLGFGAFSRGLVKNKRPAGWRMT